MRLISRMFRKKQTTRLDLALQQADLATSRFRSAAEMTTTPYSRLFWDLAAASVELRSLIEREPQTISSLRRFLFFYLPKMSELCLRWAQISHTEPLQPADATPIRDFQDYLTIIRSATDAGRRQNYANLHLGIKVLDEQLERLSL